MVYVEFLRWPCGSPAIRTWSPRCADSEISLVSTPGGVPSLGRFTNLYVYLLLYNKQFDRRYILLL